MERGTKPMSIRGTITAAVLLPLLGGAAVASDTKTAITKASTQTARIGALSVKEEEAMAFRYLQTELMVAALSCGRQEFRNKYNTFVIRYRPALKRNGRILHAIFKRSYGQRGKRRLDGYVTQLANDISVISMKQSRFCDVAGRKFDAVLGASSQTTESGLLQRAQRQ